MTLIPVCYGIYPDNPAQQAEQDCARCPQAVGCVQYTEVLNKLREVEMVQPTSTDTILTERGGRYGKFTGQAQIAQHLKRVVREYVADRQCMLANDQAEALDMICHKIARIINGDPFYHDSWADIAGYAKLVADRLETGVEK